VGSSPTSGTTQNSCKSRNLLYRVAGNVLAMYSVLTAI
jgi:hypothetical protein